MRSGPGFARSPTPPAPDAPGPADCPDQPLPSRAGSALGGAVEARWSSRIVPVHRGRESYFDGGGNRENAIEVLSGLDYSLLRRHDAVSATRALLEAVISPRALSALF